MNLPERFHRGEGGLTASLEFRQQSSTGQNAIDDQVPFCPAISQIVRSGFPEIGWCIVNGSRRFQPFRVFCAVHTPQNLTAKL